MKILHLFDDLMNLYGEYANTLALQRAVSEKGRAAEIERRSVGDELSFSEYDFIYIGSGTEKNQKVALEYRAVAGQNPACNGKFVRDVRQKDNRPRRHGI